MQERTIYDTSEALNRMAAITSAQSEVAAYNNELDRYVTGALVRIYTDNGVKVHKDGTISGNDVLRAASLYNKYVRQRFALRAADIIEDMRTRGYDVRMDMNTYRLIWKGVYNNG